MAARFLVQGGTMKWITRERPRIDRIACPWLIARFIDDDPQCLYVPPNQVKPVAGALGAIPYDVPNVELGHIGELCSFDAFLKKYELRLPALNRLAAIVRGADTHRLDLTPQSARLRRRPRDVEARHGYVRIALRMVRSSASLEDLSMLLHFNVAHLIATCPCLMWGVMAMATAVDFEADATGSPPEGWTTGVTGKGNPKWTVETDRTAPAGTKVLVQSGSGTFPWAVRKDAVMRDGTVEVKFKAV